MPQGFRLRRQPQTKHRRDLQLVYCKVPISTSDEYGSISILLYVDRDCQASRCSGVSSRKDRKEARETWKQTS